MGLYVLKKGIGGLYISVLLGFGICVLELPITIVRNAVIFCFVFVLHIAWVTHSNYILALCSW